MTETPKRRRVVLCMGQYCSMGGRAKQLYRLLEAQVAEINGDQFPGPVKLETANCLSMCGAGPNLMLYPEARAVNELDEEKLNSIIQQYLGVHPR
ncbi:MAG TPA: (2Fe-2S) ferredoxin domain-containing protein [Spirillospora sp.]|nr:(2Fe-2S) ferredoxin domain-containing protein [Spirillospora sp.]